MSVAITINHAVKIFGQKTVIPDLNLKIKSGEFFTLLGPSGCGKTTLLRMIAGFNSIEGGDFYFDDKRINGLDPSKRNIGMVFQNYAIFPHYTVRKNVEFGLKNKKVPAAEIAARTDEFLKLMHIEEYAAQMPDRLSGGQQQRVALARALVIKPDVLLMDEPLSNLDAKLRVEMRSVIKEVQRSVGITNVYVTHDQEEAMAVSDRIAVMDKGLIQHIGTPKDIYQRPANIFVAAFIGRSNIFEAVLEAGGACPRITLKNGTGFDMPNIKKEYRQNRKVLVSARPEELLLCTGTKGLIEARVKDSVFLGLNTHYFIEFKSGTAAEMIRESAIDGIIASGTEISLDLNLEKINVFTEDGSVNILEGVKNDLTDFSGLNRLESPGAGN